jgi:hypothetical protein
MIAAPQRAIAASRQSDTERSNEGLNNAIEASSKDRFRIYL